jgi:hypothetical protein
MHDSRVIASSLGENDFFAIYSEYVQIFMTVEDFSHTGKV